MKAPKTEWHSVPLSILSEKSGKPLVLDVVTVGRPDTILFLGIGGERRVQQRRAALLKKHGLTGVAIVAALPYWQVPAEKNAVMQLAVEAPAAVAGHLKHIYSIDILHVIAESQAVPGTVEAALSAPDVFNGRLGLLGPNGLIRLTRRQLASRMVASSLQFEQLAGGHSKNVGSKAGLRLAQDIWRNGIGLEVGMAVDIGPALQTLHTARPDSIRIFSGSEDALFPPHEIAQRLAQLKLTHMLQIIPGTHASPSTRFDLNQFNRVLAWARGVGRFDPPKRGLALWRRKRRDNPA